MAQATPEIFTPTQLQARACEWVGISLIAVFLINLLGNFLPPQILDPDWQLALIGNLIDNGAYPLLGLLLIGLAAYIEPENSALEKRQLRLRALACWVSIAYLLLMPMIGLACKRGLDQAFISRQREARTAQQAIVTLRAAIQSSGSLPELQFRFRQLQAPALAADAASIPLAELKSGLLDRLEANENALRASLKQPLFGRFLPILQKAFRNLLACLVLSIGFASVALTRSASRSQLQSWLTAVSSIGRLQRLSYERWQDWRDAGQERREMAQRLAFLKRIRREGERRVSGEPPRTFWPWWRHRGPHASGTVHHYDYIQQINPNQDDDPER